MPRRAGTDTLGALAKHAVAVRFNCGACGHAAEIGLPALLLKHAWATPIAEIQAKARCSACNGGEVVLKPVWITSPPAAG